MNNLLTADLITEFSSLITQLSELKQKELLNYIRNFAKENNQLNSLEREKIILSSQEYKDLIKICEADDWQISKEILEAFKAAEKVK